jgi:hypothetical protein
MADREQIERLFLNTSAQLDRLTADCREASLAAAKLFEIEKASPEAIRANSDLMRLEEMKRKARDHALQAADLLETFERFEKHLRSQNGAL